MSEMEKKEKVKVKGEGQDIEDTIWEARLSATNEIIFYLVDAFDSLESVKDRANWCPEYFNEIGLCEEDIDEVIDKVKILMRHVSSWKRNNVE